MTDFTIRTALDMQKVGKASSGSPLRNPASPGQVAGMGKYPSMSFSIPNPTAMGYLGPWNQVDRTVIMVTAVVMGSGSVAFNIEKRTTPQDAGTDLLSSELTVSGDAEVSTTSFAVTTIEAGKRLYIDISNVTGTVTQLAITMIVTGGMSSGGAGAVVIPSSTDAAASNNSIYYSTDQTKLCYKDSGGSSHALY
jgi:hypothetical protein